MSALLRRTVAGLFMVGLPGPSLDRATRAFLAEYPPGGVILFRRNMRSAAQLSRLVEAVHATGAGVSPLVAIDHEGGRVHRLRAPFTHFPPAAVVARHGLRAVQAVGRAMGRELRAIGVDLDFAPVLDVCTNPRNRVIADRAFSTDPDRAAALALAFARGLHTSGVLSCGKHFPGHGGSTGDSHFVLPRVRRSGAALRAVDLLPFRRAIAARLPALMTAHIVYPALDPRRPATLSAAICRRLLRGRLGFEGVLFSDDLEMQAIAGRAAPARSAVGALAAGCDMLLVCHSLAVARAAMEGVERAIMRERLAPRDVATALGRIQALRRCLPRRPPDRLPARGWAAHARLARQLAADQ